MSKSKSRLIQVPILARVEGEGALELQILNQEIKRLQLKIYEPPRLFEKFLEGRRHDEVLDIVARICGICPVAYQMSATHALEACFNVQPSAWVREMRRVFYCGEWIESHSLHVHLLAVPDFLGFNSVTEMAKVYPDEVRRGLRLQALGNALVSLLGARSVHPVGACIGGFYKAPTPQAVQTVLEQVNSCVTDCEALLAWLTSLKLPNNKHSFPCVALRHEQEYPMNEGKITSDRGLSIPIDEFDDHFKEFQVPYSNALHCLMQGQSYLVGPLARVNLNYDHLPQKITDLMSALTIRFPSYNMFDSVLARAIEIYYAVLEAKRILEHYQLPSASREVVQPTAGTGIGCTEAPRGLLWQKYTMNDDGLIVSAQIVPPTSQNQARIEDDLRQSLLQFGLTESDEHLRAYSEMIIRNYDPCISCSTHFLTLKVNRA